MLNYPALSAVVWEGSFERAAERLGITPSAVSQRVRGLEERLGAILIVRSQPLAATKLCAHFDRVQLLEADLAPALAPQIGRTEPPITLKVAVNADSLATWFPQACAAFMSATGILLDVTLDDEAHTADCLRSGEVVAAVTSDPEPVQGCKTFQLGQLRYAACASPTFMDQHFSDGVSPTTLMRAPHMRFDRRDPLQARWAREAYGLELVAPTHWVPSTHGFLDFAIAGMAWGLHPIKLVRSAIAANKLVELPPALPIEVTLYWTVARLHATPLRALTDAVRRVASENLHS